MSKAILVMDMPDCCADCPCSFFERSNPKLNLICGIAQEDANNIVIVLTNLKTDTHKVGMIVLKKFLDETLDLLAKLITIY